MRAGQVVVPLAPGWSVWLVVAVVPEPVATVMPKQVITRVQVNPDPRGFVLRLRVISSPVHGVPERQNAVTMRGALSDLDGV